METITVWILIAIGIGSSGGHPPVVVDRFPSRADCMQTKAQLDSIESVSRLPRYECVKAAVVR